MAGSGFINPSSAETTMRSKASLIFHVSLRKDRRLDKALLSRAVFHLGRKSRIKATSSLSTRSPPKRYCLNSGKLRPNFSLMVCMCASPSISPNWAEKRASDSKTMWLSSARLKPRRSARASRGARSSVRTMTPPRSQMTASIAVVGFIEIGLFYRTESSPILRNRGNLETTENEEIRGIAEGGYSEKEDPVHSSLGLILGRVPTLSPYQNDTGVAGSEWPKGETKNAA